MNPETILQIIKLSLEITLKFVDDMTPAQRQAVVQQHFANLDFWREVFQQISAGPKP